MTKCALERRTKDRSVRPVFRRIQIYFVIGDAMKLTVASAVAVACVIALPTAGRAQTCLGAASFSAGIAQVGASGSFTDHAKSYDVELSVGAANGVFGSVDAGQISYDGESVKSNVIGAGLGYSISAGAAARFCPLLGYSHTTLSDNTFGSTSRLDEVGFGGAFGIAAPVAHDVNLVPFVSAEYFHAEATETAVGFGSDTQSEDFGVLELGVGFVFSKMVTFRPSFSIPLGLNGAKTSVGITLAINFGHASATP